MSSAVLAPPRTQKSRSSSAGCDSTAIDGSLPFPKVRRWLEYNLFPLLFTSSEQNRSHLLPHCLWYSSSKPLGVASSLLSISLSFSSSSIQNSSHLLHIVSASAPSNLQKLLHLYSPSRSLFHLHYKIVLIRVHAVSGIAPPCLSKLLHLSSPFRSLLLQYKIALIGFHTVSYWAIQRSWFARVNAPCNLSRKTSREVAAHFRADF